MYLAATLDFPAPPIPDINTRLSTIVLLCSPSILFLSKYDITSLNIFGLFKTAIPIFATYCCTVKGTIFLSSSDICDYRNLFQSLLFNEILVINPISLSYNVKSLYSKSSSSFVEVYWITLVLDSYKHNFSKIFELDNIYSIVYPELSNLLKLAYNNSSSNWSLKLSSSVFIFSYPSRRSNSLSSIVNFNSFLNPSINCSLTLSNFSAVTVNLLALFTAFLVDKSILDSISLKYFCNSYSHIIKVSSDISGSNSTSYENLDLLLFII